MPDKEMQTTKIHPVLSPQTTAFPSLNSGFSTSHSASEHLNPQPSSEERLPSPRQAELGVTRAQDENQINTANAPVGDRSSVLESDRNNPSLPSDESQRTQEAENPSALPAPESLTTTPQKSFREHRAGRHRKTYSIDSIPRQTIIKALQSRPPATSNMSIATSLNSIVQGKDENKEGDKNDATAMVSENLSKALSDLNIGSECLSAKMAALASPCFFHKKFDKAVNIEKVLEEIHDDDTISHSRLMQTATSVREVAKQIQRRPIKMTVRNVMIVTKARDNQLVHLTRELAEWLLCTPRYGSEVGVNVYVDHKLRKSKRFDMDSLLAKDPRFENMLRFWTPELCWTSPEKFDLVLTLGGDGTVLYTSWLFQRIVPPILSFSLGSLGFLTNFEFNKYKDALNKIMGEAGMRVSVRMRFTCTVYRYQPNASADSPTHIEAEQFEVLNEVVIDRGPSPYVSNLELYGDNNLLTVVQADGCIFSTPTGSTAYSLSAGGSLVHPDIPAILLTPICPHTLSFRPMHLPDSMLLRVAVPRNSRATAYCAFDGKGRVELRQGDHVTIAASQYPFPTVLSQPTEWFDSIGRTLRWNTRGAMQKAWDGDESNADAVKEKDTGFDIDIDNDEADRDSGYSAEGSSVGVGGHISPIRKNTLTSFA